MSGSALAPTPDLQATDRGDLLTLSFADPQAGLYGQARVALPADGGPQALVAVFEAERVVAAREVPATAVVVSSTAPGLWSARFDGQPGGSGAFSLELQASGPRAPLDDPQHAAGDGGSAQQICSVSGTVTLGAKEVTIAGGGQIGLVRGAGDWSQRRLWREIDCWLGEDQGLTVRTSRPVGIGEHGGELVGAVLIAGEPPLAAPIDEARISTAYDRRDSQRRAGLELWATEDSDYPRRLAGETLMATTVRTGADGQPALRWDCAFVRWHMEGVQGVGPYSIVRRERG